MVAVIGRLPLGDVAVEPLAVQRLAEEGQIGGELARDRAVIRRPSRAGSGSRPPQRRLRACEASPRSQRYSVSPSRWPTQRESTKRRSLSRLT